MSDLLSPVELAQLEALRREDSFARDVWQQVIRITKSRPFDRVQQRAKDFLRFVVAKTLLGQAEHVKEMTIAVGVFGRSADFDPGESSTVRVAASDLRERLADYAQTEGRGDVIEITLPLNSYVPKIADRRISISIGPFENWHPLGEHAHLCETIARELAYRLEKAGLRSTLVEDANPARPARYSLRGSVETQDERLRVNLSLADTEGGTILCSRVVEDRREELLKLTGEIAVALLESLQQAGDLPTVSGVTVRRRA